MPELSFPDFPAAEELRRGYGEDSSRDLALLDTNTIIYCLKSREPASSGFRAAQ